MGKKTTTDSSTREMFRNDGDLFDDSLQKELEELKNQPVECLGMTFLNDDARRKYFIERLREHLEDPEFRKIAGFPDGSDEDIIALSDPPFYTACPNPFLAEAIRNTPSGTTASTPRVDPFVFDVSEGKNNPIYTSHSYHTKVPHKAVMRYILHYTNPGDVVLDGFCGTGMAGVAAQLCGDAKEIASMGYRVDEDGSIWQKGGIEQDGPWKLVSKVGQRRAILSDLSPAATFIARSYNNPPQVTSFTSKATELLRAIENECGWMFKSQHVDGQTGTINYTIWSDVFICVECGGEVVFWDVALDRDAGRILNTFPCPHCNTSLTKRSLDRAWEVVHDDALHGAIKIAKQQPVEINYSVGNKRFVKRPDEYDMELLGRIANMPIPYDYPLTVLPHGVNTRQPIASHGVTHVHHFLTRRNLYTMAAAIDRARDWQPSLLDLLVNMLTRVSRQSSLHVSNYFHGGGGVCKGHLTGTLYLPSLSPELPAPKVIGDRIRTVTRGYSQMSACRPGNVFIETASITESRLPNESVDYAFIDPPFGANINYSEVNFVDESWLRVTTTNKCEAIENAAQGKTLHDYRQLMTECFTEIHRVLKPGRWMTVEFSNTKASVWNAIQGALADAGFIVANVSALDKKLGSFKAVTTPTAVKQDLVITAYKPNGGFADRFVEEAQSEEGVWDFVRTHLSYLPIAKPQGVTFRFVAERDPRLLFDQVVGYFVRRGFSVPISSPEFQKGLAQRFSERDGMYFLPDQVARYDKVKMRAQHLDESHLFVLDEQSAIQWLRQQLQLKPMMFSDINPMFMKQLAGWSKNEKPLELHVLLEENFIRYDGFAEVPSQIHSYLSTNYKELRKKSKCDANLRAKAKDRWYVPDPNKAGDLEKIREKSLLREFEAFRKTTSTRNAVFRIEAIRTGFKAAYDNRDYNTIVEVAKTLPQNVLQEDEKLLMYFDVAQMRLGKDGNDNTELI